MRQRRFTPVEGWMLDLIGVDRSRAAHCSDAEIRRMLGIAWLVIAVWAWQSFIYVVALHIALAPPAFRPELLSLAACFSCLVQLGELNLFVRPAWEREADKVLARMLENDHA
jgi:hypothetical protein